MRRKRHWIPSGVLRRFNKIRARKQRDLRRELVQYAGYHSGRAPAPLPPRIVVEAVMMGVRVPRSLRSSKTGHFEAMRSWLRWILR